MMKKIILSLLLISFFIPVNVFASNIKNPVIPGEIGDIPTANIDTQNARASAAIAILLARFFSAALAVGSVIMMVYFVISAYRWITAGGDTNSVTAARQGIMNAVIGMAVLASIFAIANLIAPLLGLSGEGRPCQFPAEICWPTF